MARRKEPSIPDALLDQLLSGADAMTAFDPGGLPDGLKKALANARGIPVAEASRQVAEIEAAHQSTVDRTAEGAEQAADATADVVSTGALLAFAGLVPAPLRAGSAAGRESSIRCSQIVWRRRVCGAPDPEDRPSARAGAVRSGHYG